MQKMISFMLVSLFVLALAVGIIAWLTLVWKFVQIPFNLKPGLSIWSSGANPFNVIFNSDSLTPKGVQLLKQSGIALMVFITACIAGVVFGLAVYWFASGS
jgi:hypothetical protein